MVKFIFVLFIALVAGCSSATKTLKYGYLPGGDYPYCARKKPVDLERSAYRLSIVDLRKENQLSCSDLDVPRDSELEGSFGLSFFEHYVSAMIELNNGVVDPESKNSLSIELKALSGSLSGAYPVPWTELAHYSPFTAPLKCNAPSESIGRLNSARSLRKSWLLTQGALSPCLG